jgi:hypothetical protein
MFEIFLVFIIDLVKWYMFQNKPTQNDNRISMNLFLPVVIELKELHPLRYYFLENKRFTTNCY